MDLFNLYILNVYHTKFSAIRYVVKQEPLFSDFCICDLVWETGLIATITDIHFSSVHESCTHALPRNTKYLIIDGQVCFYRWLPTNAVKPQGCISWPWRALIRLHGVQNYSWWRSWRPLRIVSVCVPYWRYSTALWVRLGAITRLWLLTRPQLPPHPLPRAHPQSVILQSWKKHPKNQ